MARFLIGCVAATVMTVGMMGSANAQGWGAYGYGGSGHHHHDRYAAGPGYSSVPGYSNYTYGGSYNVYPQAYPSRTHLDYHPASIQRHHGHYDYVPGHYDAHRSGRGHW